jgi:hypothetical protein
MKKIILNVTFVIFCSIVLICFKGCREEKEDCQTCKKIICGIAGCDVFEERILCDETEIKQLEESSSGTLIWECE